MLKSQDLIWPPSVPSASLILTSPAFAVHQFPLLLPFLLWMDSWWVNPVSILPYTIHAASPFLPAPSGLLPTLDRSKHSPPPRHLPLCCWAMLEKATMPGASCLLESQDSIATFSHVPHHSCPKPSSWLPNHHPIPESCPQEICLNFREKWSFQRDQTRSSMPSD